VQRTTCYTVHCDSPSYSKLATTAGPARQSSSRCPSSSYRAPPGARLAPASPIYIVRRLPVQFTVDCNEEFSHSVQQRLRLLAIAFPVYCDYNLFSSVDCSEEFSHHNSQVYDALATAAVITATVYYDNSQAIRLQFSSTSGLQRDQLKSSSQDNENCCVQFTVGCNGGIFYIGGSTPCGLLRHLPIVRASEELST